MNPPVYETIRVSRPALHVDQITLNRPEFSNALNTQMMRELGECFRAYYVNPADTRVIIVTGEGDRAFCAGGDLKERNGMTDATWQHQHAILEQSVQALMQCPVPMVAAVNGSCFGGGLEVALTCDFIVTSEAARFGFPEGRLGIMPGACGTQNLVRACGQRRAKEIMLTGRAFTAAEALDWGIANHCCDHDALYDTTLKITEDMCRVAPVSARQIKKSINVAVQTDLATGFAYEIEAYNRTVPTQDRHEGVAAFNEKREPQFTGS